MIPEDDHAANSLSTQKTIIDRIVYLSNLLAPANFLLTPKDYATITQARAKMQIQLGWIKRPYP